MARFILIVALLLPLPVQAQQAHILSLTDQQIDSIITAGGQCLDRTNSYVCAELVIYIRNLLQAARKPPEPKAEKP